MPSCCTTNTLRYPGRAVDWRVTWKVIQLPLTVALSSSVPMRAARTNGADLPCL